MVAGLNQMGIQLNFAKGSGLGLSICKEIVEKFNGHLVLKSEIEVGTTVSIILPLT